MSARGVTIAMACDRAYLFPFAVALTSFRRHCPSALSLRFGLARDWQARLSPGELARILELADSLGVTAHPVEVPIDVDDLPPTLHISPTAFVKPAMFDDCDAGETIVWLDADMIAVRDWTAMIDLSDGHAVSAVREAQPTFETQWACDSTDWYVNTGVVVVQGSAWQRDFAGRWRPYVADYARHGFRYLDQDVLNALVRDRWNPLPQEFNFRLGRSGSWTDPAIVHFAGWWKPWLRTARQMSRLDEDWTKAFAAYRQAEDELLKHLHDETSAQARGFWMARARRQRGVAGWKAWRHYARGVLRDEG